MRLTSTERPSYEECLRDEIAMDVMRTYRIDEDRLRAVHEYARGTERDANDLIAEWAYDQADAMLKARMREEPTND